MKYSNMFLELVNSHTAQIRALRKKMEELDRAEKISVFDERGNMIHSVRNEELELYIETLKDSLLNRMKKLEEELQTALENSK